MRATMRRACAFLFCFIFAHCPVPVLLSVRPLFKVDWLPEALQPDQ